MSKNLANKKKLQQTEKNDQGLNIVINGCELDL
jgi:hypothetical protein